MNVIRKDYILDRWVYYAVSRKQRPHEFKQQTKALESKICFFCPGNESLTPPEIGRLEYKGKWRMRWFPNKFAAIEKKGNPKIKAKGLFLEGCAYGIHEIIVETNHHKSQLWDLPTAHIKDWLEVIKVRLNELNKNKGIKYVSVFKNYGIEAGTSLLHSHTQLMALPQIPSLVVEEVKAASLYYKKHKKCAYCSIIKSESKTTRKIFENKSFIAIAPFASRFNYEAWVFPKAHVRALGDIAISEIPQLADILKRILVKLKSINASYNLYIHYSPMAEDLHLHVEITPRIAKWGGFELSTNAIINSVMPEAAARFYKSQ